ncbi:hypothetical protein COCON_G00112920 [Conger conger]|uniref:Uncharacterized protein n=1 Tax=Conger conger TaxID=82655 RepID=A0A9Q1DKB1_CONCO|nr:hypothetical protein COCON_G00112920 [Conger conger]
MYLSVYNNLGAHAKRLSQPGTEDVEPVSSLPRVRYLTSGLNGALRVPVCGYARIWSQVQPLLWQHVTEIMDLRQPEDERAVSKCTAKSGSVERGLECHDITGVSHSHLEDVFLSLRTPYGWEVDSEALPVDG